MEIDHFWNIPPSVIARCELDMETQQFLRELETETKTANIIANFHMT